MEKNSRALHRAVVIGLMAAVVFACTEFLGIRIPTPTGTTQLKTANAVCLMTGLLFGGWIGGLASGLGSALFDLTFPEYAKDCWLTFLFFFAMGAVCGAIAHSGGSGGRSRTKNWLAALCGASVYWALYIGKSVLFLVLSGSACGAALVATVPKMIAAAVNGIFGVTAANFLAELLRPPLEKNGVFRNL